MCVVQRNPLIGRRYESYTLSDPNCGSGVLVRTVSLGTKEIGVTNRVSTRTLSPIRLYSGDLKNDLEDPFSGEGTRLHRFDYPVSGRRRPPVEMFVSFCVFWTDAHFGCVFFRLGFRHPSQRTVIVDSRI